MNLKHYCDQCGEVLDNNFTYPTLNIKYESYIFCRDNCKNDFINDMSKDVFIDLRGRWIED